MSGLCVSANLHVCLLSADGLEERRQGMARQLQQAAVHDAASEVQGQYLPEH